MQRIQIHDFTGDYTVVWPFSIASPIGWYSAESWNSLTNTLPDRSGNGNNAVTTGLYSGVGAGDNIPSSFLRIYISH